MTWTSYVSQIDVELEPINVLLQLSRLIGGVGASTSARKGPSNSPQQRLARFKKAYSHTLQVWHRLSPQRADAHSIEAIRVCLQRLTTLLHDDTRAPAPHLCLSFAASSQFYITVTRIALSLSNEDVIREAVAWFAALVDNDEENLLGDERFAEALMSFADSVSGPRGVPTGSHTEGEILELMFGIAAKIRLEPDLLPIWFMSEEQAASNAAPLGDPNRFPLCYQFISRVYNEGRAGDFARTGLLYIFESVTHSPELQRWIIESDLPTLMASGLGALYSQLSRKLTIEHPPDTLPIILALSADEGPRKADEDVDNFYSEELQSQLTTFMSNLMFWQDILEHCRSLEIKQTLVDHFQVFFLQQILYPSLLESSDIDGGSSVAVLTYLWRILDSVEHPDLIHLILQYLLALDDPLANHPMTPRSPAAEKRRESLLSLSQEDGGEDQLNPSFFNLTDLIIASVQSQNSETLTAALRLITVLLMKHHTQSYSSLLRITTTKLPDLDRSVGALQMEMSIYYDLACSFGGLAGMDEAYENCLRDALAMIESHICSSSRLGMNGISLPASGRHRSAILEDDSSAIQSHRLLLDDPLIMSLMNLLRNFFTNDVETNLGLTNVVTYLAACPFTSLEGWMVLDPQRYHFDLGKAQELSATTEDSQVDEAGIAQIDPDKEKEDVRVGAFKAACRSPEWSSEDSPALVQVLQYLFSQFELIRASTPNLDQLIAGRKRAFQGANEVEDEMKAPFTPAFSPRVSTPVSTSRASSKTRLHRPDPPLRGTATPNGTPTASRGRIIGSAQQLQARAQSPTGSIKSGRSIQIPAAESSTRTNGRGLSTSPSKISRALSPLASVMSAEEAGMPSITAGSREARAAETLILDRRLYFPMGTQGAPASETSKSEETPESLSKGDAEEDHRKASNTSDEDDDNGEGYFVTTSNESTKREASLTHVLTNIVILQEFILELMALVQVRSSLVDGDIKFQ